ncbi:MAG: radical SAM protein [Anaerolineales bacterium]
MKNNNGQLELHVLMADDINIAFHPPSLTLLKVGRQAAEVLEDYEKGQLPEEIAAQRGCSIDEVTTLLQQLSEQLDKQPDATPIPIGPLSGTLTMVVSRDCNLRCKYCYADGGAYQKERMRMSKDTALQAIDLFLNSKDGFRFQEIVFFGGEPTLNLPVIQSVAEYVENLFASGKIAHRPEMGMVTNGTRITDEFCELVEKYGLQVTISLDGPPEVNDSLRFDVGGHGAFSAIAQGIRKLQQATGGLEPRMIECTVTNKHLESGMTYDFLVKYFIDTFGIRQHHIVPVCDWNESRLELSEAEAVEWETAMYTRFVEALAEGNLQVTKLGIRAVRMLNSKKFNPFLCIAGFTSITVDADGSIYPCYQLNNESCYMGHISEQDTLESNRFHDIVNAFVDNNKINHPQCASCWVRPLCTGCFGHMYLRTGSPHGRVDEICNRRKIATETLLLDLVRLRTDEKKWQKAIQTAKASSSLNSQ